MRMVDIIQKKRDGLELSPAEINFFVEGYTKDEIPDYQVSALLMTIYFNDMSEQERSDLAMAMLHSGETLDLSSIPGIKIDKHSTGGVGDKISIPLAALVAAVGVKNPMISGRGLGHTGGTLDKLEAIPGFNVDLTVDEFIAQVKDIGVAIISATANLAPADRKIYALRDVTSTVEAIPLIASSVMSKKIASGTQGLVLDVKTGNGAFMKTEERSAELARALVSIGKMAGLNCVALITDMNQPLGNTIGNGLEIKESIEVLQGKGPKDVTELTLILGSYMVMMAEKANSLEAARRLLNDALANGAGLAKFKEMVAAQGGDVRVIDDPNQMCQVTNKVVLPAKTSGIINQMETDQLGIASMLLGGGRAKKDDLVDHQVGLVLHHKIGDTVTAGEPLVTVYANKKDINVETAKIYAAITIGNEPTLYPLIHQVITQE